MEGGRASIDRERVKMDGGRVSVEGGVGRTEEALVWREVWEGRREC